MNLSKTPKINSILIIYTTILFCIIAIAQANEFCPKLDLPGQCANGETNKNWHLSLPIRNVSNADICTAMDQIELGKSRKKAKFTDQQNANILKLLFSANEINSLTDNHKIELKKMADETAFLLFVWNALFFIVVGIISIIFLPNATKICRHFLGDKRSEEKRQQQKRAFIRSKYRRQQQWETLDDSVANFRMPIGRTNRIETFLPKSKKSPNDNTTDQKEQQNFSFRMNSQFNASAEHEQRHQQRFKCDGANDFVEWVPIAAVESPKCIETIVDSKMEEEKKDVDNSDIVWVPIEQPKSVKTVRRKPRKCKNKEKETVVVHQQSLPPLMDDIQMAASDDHSKRAGSDPPKAKKTKADWDIVVQMFESGVSQTEIARQLKVPRNQIYYIIARSRIQGRIRSQPQRKGRKKQHKNDDE